MNNEQVKYFVDEGNKVVVAEADYCQWDVLEILNKKFISNVTSAFEVNHAWHGEHPDFFMNKKYRAVVRLRDGDVWNEQVGKNKAYNKLTDVYHKGLNKRLARYAKAFRQIADDIDQFLEGKEI